MPTNRGATRPSILDQGYADPQEFMEQALARMTPEQLQCYAGLGRNNFTEFITAWVDPHTGHRFVRFRCTNGCRRFRVTEIGYGVRHHKYEPAVEEHLQNYGTQGLGIPGSDAREALLMDWVDKLIESKMTDQPTPIEAGKKSVKKTAAKKSTRRRTRKAS